MASQVADQSSLIRSSTVDLCLASVGMGWLPDQAGGLNRYFYDLLNGFNFKRRAFDSNAWVAGPASLGEEANGLDVRSFASRSDRLPMRLYKARRMLKKIVANSPDVIASHFALYTAPGIDLLRHLPLVCHFHGPWADESAREGDRGLSNQFKRRLEATVYQRADRLITLSEAFKRVLIERYGVDEGRIRVIPGGVDLERFDRTSMNQGTKHAARIQLGWDTDRPTIFCVRRLVPRMGIDRLIAAVETLVDRHPDVQVMIAGRGPVANSLQQQIKSLGVNRNIRLLGFISDDDLPIAYLAADFSVVPTVALEGFGLIAAESLASGTPCLVTPVGGLPEVVGGLSQRLIFESDSVADIAMGIHEALTHPSSLPEATACRAYAEQKFDWYRIIDQILEVYLEAIACRNGLK